MGPSRSALASALVLFVAGCAAEPAVAIEPVIFGADDRVEVHDVTDATLREMVARSVPALVRANRIEIDSVTGAVALLGPTLQEGHGLCPDQAFLDEPAVASCSATLIDDDLVLTAGHCVDAIPCADQRYVFGWYYDAPGVLRTLDTASVYACAEVVASRLDLADDFAIVRLDRDAPGPPVPVRLEPVAVGEAVSLAGYPLGIPMKVVEDGAVTALRTASSFYARLDAHPGNSGSGVFDASYRVVGELTAGPIHAFDDGGTCTTLRVIGEDTTTTETIHSVIPAIAALCASGSSSERLCPNVCGDGTCGVAEDCPADCGIDGGLEPDAGPPAAMDDAGPIARVDAGAPPALARGCGCRAAGGRSPDGLALVAIAAAIAARRARALRAQARTRCRDRSSTPRGRASTCARRRASRSRRTS